MVYDNYYYRKHTNTVGFVYPLAQSAIPLPLDVTLDHDPMTQRRCCDPLTSAACGWWRNVGEVGVGGGDGGWVGVPLFVCLFLCW